MRLRWEYQAFQISGGSLVEGLNKIGADGWEAVSIQETPSHHLVIGKRPASMISIPANAVELPMHRMAKGRA